MDKKGSNLNLETQMQRTHILLKRNKIAAAKSSQMVAFMRTLPPQNLALMILNLIVGLSSIVHKKRLGKLLKENIDADVFTEIEPLLEELDDGPRLTVKMLNNAVHSL